MQTKILTAILLITPLSCRESPPEPPLIFGPTPRIELTVSDVGVTEMWLRIRILDSAGQRGFSLTRDSQLLLFYPFGAPLDTVILDGGLVPGHTYMYRAYRFSHGNLTDSSIVQPRTLDTTSHNFTWEIDTLGAGSSSALYDVAIINDTLAYAVGEIYLKDSTGQLDPILYNLAIWNGGQWKLLRVPYFYQGQPSYSRIKWIFALSQIDIWFGNAVHWDGQQFQNVDIGDQIFLGIGSNKMWGTSSRDLFAVGGSGTVAHYDGYTWHQLQSGTTLDIYDVFGAPQNRTSGYEIDAVAAKLFKSSERSIMRLTATNVSQLSTNGIAYALSSIWFKPGRVYYAVGDGLFRKYAIDSSDPWKDITAGITNYLLYSVRGNDVNDVFVVGSFGEVLHFNGVTWKSYRLQTAIPAGEWYSVAVKGDLVIAVGDDSPRALVLVGHRPH